MILIRHANSVYNLAFENISKRIERSQATQREYFDLAADERVIDCAISDLGTKQSQEATLIANQLSKVKIILVSPMRRAL